MADDPVMAEASRSLARFARNGRQRRPERAAAGWTRTVGQKETVGQEDRPCGFLGCDGRCCWAARSAGS